MSLFDTDDKAFEPTNADVSADRSTLPSTGPGGREGESDSLQFYTADLNRLKACSRGSSKSTVVKDFCKQLNSVLENKPPISRAKVQAITKSALAAGPYYKHIVCNIERFIQKCKSEYKLPGLYLIDSVVRQSRHQFGVARDVFGPRFLRNIDNTFRSLIQCSNDDKKKIIRVLNLWQRGAVFPDDKISVLMRIISGEDNGAGTIKSSVGGEPLEAVSAENRRFEDLTDAQQAMPDASTDGKSVEKMLELQDALSCLQRAKDSGVDIKSLLINKDGNLRNIDNSLIMEIHQLTSQLLDEQTDGGSRTDSATFPGKRRMVSPIDQFVQNKEIKPNSSSTAQNISQLSGARNRNDQVGPFAATAANISDHMNRVDSMARHPSLTDFSALNASHQLSEKDANVKGMMPEYQMDHNQGSDSLVSFPNMFPTSQLPVVNIPQYSQFFPQPRVMSAAPSRPTTATGGPTFESMSSANSAVDVNQVKIIGQADYNYRRLTENFAADQIACSTEKFPNATHGTFRTMGQLPTSTVIPPANEHHYRPGITTVGMMTRPALQATNYAVMNQPNLGTAVQHPMQAVQFGLSHPVAIPDNAQQRPLWDPTVGWRPGLSGDKRNFSRPLLPTPKMGCTSMELNTAVVNIPANSATNQLPPTADMFRSILPPQVSAPNNAQPTPQQSLPKPGFVPVPALIAGEQQPDKDERRPMSPSQRPFSAAQPAWPGASSTDPYPKWPNRAADSSVTGFDQSGAKTRDDDGRSFWQHPSEKTESHQQFDTGKQSNQPVRRDSKSSCWSDDNDMDAGPTRRLSLSQRIEAAVRSPNYSSSHQHRSSRHSGKSSSRKDSRFDSGSHDDKRRHFRQSERESNFESAERPVLDKDERRETPASYSTEDNGPDFAEKYQRSKGSSSSRYKSSREPLSRRERDRERRQLDLPPLKDGHIIVCSKTVWLGHLPKMVSEGEIRDELERMGTISDIKLVPPRGCAFVCFENRRHAARCVEKMQKDTKILGNTIKLCWAVNIGVKDKFDKWDPKYGCTYIPIDEKLEKMTGAELIGLSDGGLLDEGSMPESILEKVKDAKNEIANTAAKNAEIAVQALNQLPNTQVTPTSEPAASPLTNVQTGFANSGVEAFLGSPSSSNGPPVFRAPQNPFSFMTTVPQTHPITGSNPPYNMEIGFRCGTPTSDGQATLAPRPWAVNNSGPFAGFQTVVIQHGPSFPTWSRPPVGQMGSAAYYGSAAQLQTSAIPVPNIAGVDLQQQADAAARHQRMAAEQQNSHRAGNFGPSGQHNVYDARLARTTQEDMSVGPANVDDKTVGTDLNRCPLVRASLQEPDKCAASGQEEGTDTTPLGDTKKSESNETLSQQQSNETSNSQILWEQSCNSEKALKALSTDHDKTPSSQSVPDDEPSQQQEDLGAGSEATTPKSQLAPVEESTKSPLQGRYAESPITEHAQSQGFAIPPNSYNMPDMSMPPPPVMQHHYPDRFATPPIRPPYRGANPMRPSPPTPFPFYHHQRPQMNPIRRVWNRNFAPPPPPQFYDARRFPPNAFPQMYSDPDVGGFEGRRPFRGSRFNPRYRWPHPQRFPNSNFQQQQPFYHQKSRNDGRPYVRDEQFASREAEEVNEQTATTPERSTRPSILGDPPVMSSLPSSDQQIQPDEDYPSATASEPTDLAENEPTASKPTDLADNEPTAAETVPDPENNDDRLSMNCSPTPNESADVAEDEGVTEQPENADAGSTTF